MPMRLSDYINSFSYREDPHRLSNWTQRLDKARRHLFDFDYPIYEDPSNPEFKSEIKRDIELGILRRYYKRELGSSGGTIADFKHDLEEWLNIRMPYYNEILFTLSLDYDLLDNSHLKEQYTRKVDDTLTEGVKRNETIDNDRKTLVEATSDIDREAETDEVNTTNTTDNFRGIELDTPQGTQNIDDMSFKHASAGSITRNTEDLESDTNTKSKGSDSQKTKSDTTDTIGIESVSASDKEQEKNRIETYTRERRGKIGVNTYPKLIADYRKNIVNVVEDIVLEADNLFYQIYD